MTDFEAETGDLGFLLALRPRLPLLLLAAFLTPGLAGNETDPSRPGLFTKIPPSSSGIA